MAYVQKEDISIKILSQDISVSPLGLVLSSIIGFGVSRASFCPALSARSWSCGLVLGYPSCFTGGDFDNFLEITVPKSPPKFLFCEISTAQLLLLFHNVEISKLAEKDLV